MNKEKNTKKKTEETEINILKNIENKLDKLIGIISIQGKEQKIQVQILTAMGFTSTEVALLIETTPENVRKINSREKNKKSKGIRIPKDTSYKKENEEQ